MARDLLDFEAPLGELLMELDELTLQPPTRDRDEAIATLRTRLEAKRFELYGALTPWQYVLVARHAERPSCLHYVDALFTDFVEVHGDRRFGDDHAIIAGLALHRGREVMVVGHQKGRDTRQKIYRNFGYARPEGYRKALRAMKLAEKFDRPIVVFIDTPAAYPGIESEERGVAEAIAYNLREMSMLEVPIVVAVTGEGGSGGALGIAVGDRILMQEYAIYSVIPPEGCAAILWRDANRRVEAAGALKLTAPDLLALGVVDEVVPEPVGGAHADHAAASARLDESIARALKELGDQPVELLLAHRYQKFRQMGGAGVAFRETDTEASSTGESSPATDATSDLGTSDV